jgi:NAD(P)-dependent dehydrogenase (short-subunit alcohol dehydrogenase family)
MNPSSEFEGKRYIISGASSGIGKKITLDLAGLGANILALGRNKENLDSIKALYPDKIVIEAIDITDFSQLNNVVGKFSVEGKIDGCVHSAGINKFTPLRIFNWDIFEKIMKINLYAGVELVRLLSSKKISNDNCSIVLISSIAGIKGEVGFTAYSASKGALISAVKCMALELAPGKIRVNSISPGVVKTGLSDSMEKFYPDGMESIIKKHPAGIGSVDDISNLVIFLLSSNSRWVTGSNIVIDGGYSIN